MPFESLASGTFHMQHAKPLGWTIALTLGLSPLPVQGDDGIAPDVWIRLLDVSGVSSPDIESVSNAGDVTLMSQASMTSGCPSLPSYSPDWYVCGRVDTSPIPAVNYCVIQRLSPTVDFARLDAGSQVVNGLVVNGALTCPLYGPLAVTYSTLPWRLNRFYATDATADGQLVVGELQFRSSSSIGATAAKWTPSVGLTRVNVPPNSSAYLRMSDDGSVIAGASSSFVTSSRAILIAGSEYIDLPTRAAGGTASESRALDVSGDGSTIVGMVRIGGQSFWTDGTAVRWVDAWRPEPIQSVMTAINPDAQLPGWRLTRALRVSPNGRFAAGAAFNASTQQEAFWVAKLPPPAGICFREIWESSQVDVVPGWDHVGIYSNGHVWESHPGYPNDVYWDNLRENGVPGIGTASGVMGFHTLGSFQYAGNSRKLVPVEAELAERMAAFAESKIGTGFARFRYNFTDPALLAQSAAPSIQKGLTIHPGSCLSSSDCPGNDVHADDAIRYTCVGLVEAAAEAAGVHGGQGFVPNALEGIETPWGTMPLLSPELLKWCLDNPESSSRLRFAFTTGIPAVTGWIYSRGTVRILDGLRREVCTAFPCLRSGRAPFVFADDATTTRNYVVLSPAGGQWTVEVTGSGDRSVISFSGGRQAINISEVIPWGQTRSYTFDVACPADVWGPLDRPDGTVALSDLFAILNWFFDRDPRADFNYSGDVSVEDLFDFFAAYFAGCP